VEKQNCLKRQQKKPYLWRKAGGTHYISVPKADLLEDEFVASALRQAGVLEDEIEAFLATYSKVPNRSN
jgi:hypothetical protein